MASASNEKKKGRPKGSKPKSSVSDNAILNTISDNVVTSEPQEIEVALEEIEFDGTTYLKDDDNQIYDFESCDEIGKIVDGKLVLNE